MVVIECTRAYDEADITAVVGDSYTVHYIVFSPSDLGVPSTRFRKYMVLLHRQGCLRWQDGHGV